MSESESISDKVRNLIRTKIDSGFQLPDKNSVIELNKLVRDELKLKSGWSSDVKTIIGEIMNEKNMKLPDKAFNQNKMGNLRVELVQESEPEPTPEPENQILQNPHGTLPKGFGQESTSIQRAPTQTEQTEQQQETKPLLPLTPQQEKQQEELIVKSFGFLEKIYIALGVVKGDEAEQKEIEKPKPLEQFHGEVEGFAKELNRFMIDQNIRLPAYLNALALGISGFMIFGMPLVKMVVFDKKKLDYDNRFNDVGENKV